MEAWVQSFSKKGYGVAEHVEVAHTVPGDRILLELTRKKRLPQKGRLLEILAPSKDRVEPRCIHARTCGGCSWQQMAYPAQAKEKQLRVEEAFDQKADPILLPKDPWRYRNKMEFTFSENRAGQRFLGLMIAQAEPYVFNLTECHLANPWFAKVVNSVRTWWESSTIKAYHPPKDEGSLRYLTLREGMRTGQKMAILNVSGNPIYAPSRKDLEAFTAAVTEGVEGEISIFLRIHQTKKGKPTQFYEMHLQGPDSIIEKLELAVGTFEFTISPSSFFQPNTLGAELLYNTALSMVEGEVVYDLYCGTCTLGMAAAKKAREVIGIELSKEAVMDGEVNLARNHMTNMRLYQGDVGQVLMRLDGRKPDSVILDPPRAGLDPLALYHLKKILPNQIVYISCNPLTQVENVKELLQSGYRLTRLQPVDQFPHTYHIENIALLFKGT